MAEYIAHNYPDIKGFRRGKVLLHRAMYQRTAIKKGVEPSIESALYERTKLKQPKLSPLLREMIPQAIQVFRDQYVMEFINSVKAALIKQMKQFILELGKDCTISASEQFGVVAKRQINGADLKLLFKFASLIQK